ncbi:MAG TPA: adenosine deaminase family protein [Chloroflexota bacterium]
MSDRDASSDSVQIAQRLPKVEIHVHLEGSMQPATLLRLGRKHGEETSRISVHYVGRGLLGFGIGGDEANFPPEMFVDAFSRVKEAGLRCTVHAGEAAGAESMWGVLRALDAERLGHGVHAHDDPALLAYLRDTQTPVDMCPVSNVRTGAVASLQEHPIGRYLREGLLVTLNSDDPPMFGTSITNEYRVLLDELEFDLDQIQQLAINGIRASFLETEQKQQLEREFRQEFDDVRAAAGGKAPK